MGAHDIWNHNYSNLDFSPEWIGEPAGKASNAQVDARGRLGVGWIAERFFIIFGSADRLQRLCESKV